MLWRRTDRFESAPPAAPVRVFHIEDDPLAVDTVARLLSRWPEYRYEGAAFTGETSVARCAELKPDVVLLDLGLPDQDGFEVLDQLRASNNPPVVLLLTMRADEAFLYRVMLRHVSGVLWKSPRIHLELRHALAVCRDGDGFFPTEVSARLDGFRRDPRAFFKLLSDREISLLPLLGRGETDDTIALHVGVAASTIHSHRQNIARKLDLHTSAELMRWCAAKGFSHFPQPAQIR